MDLKKKIMVYKVGFIYSNLYGYLLDKCIKLNLKTSRTLCNFIIFTMIKLLQV